MLRFDSEQHFERHCEHINEALPLMERGEFEAAIVELDAALALGESPNCRWNRALALLSVGRYLEGWRDFEARLELFPQWKRGDQLRRDLPRWRGERLDGKRLVVFHEAGYGDSLMLLRYVGVLRERGIRLALAMPSELERLASQLAPLVGELSERDVGSSTYDLMAVLDQTPQTIPTGAYLEVSPALREHWRSQLSRRPKIGIAWSSARTTHNHRNIPLAEFLELLDAPDCSLVSLQAHDQEEARARGVVTPKLEDFADVAALASLMDVVVCIDTASLHVAGAIGHPCVFAILPHVACWRWRNGNPWYPGIKPCGQDAIGDWPSAFQKIRRVGDHGRYDPQSAGASNLLCVDDA